MIIRVKYWHAKTVCPSVIENWVIKDRLDYAKKAFELANELNNKPLLEMVNETFVPYLQ